MPSCGASVHRVAFPRADTDRYLAENFKLADRGKLIDEVYAAIEG